MTQEIPGVPLTAIPDAATPNNDIGTPTAAQQFQSLQRLSVIDLVGPPPCNRQEVNLEQRTEVLRLCANLLVTAVNALDGIFLRKDGTQQQDSDSGVTANMPMNGNIMTGLGNGANPGDSVCYSQLSAVISALSLYATLAGNPVFTGNPAANTPSPGDNTGKLATTAFVQAALAGSTYTAIECNYTGSTYTYTATRDVLVFLTLQGGGAGGSSDSNNGHAGGAGGTAVNIPIQMANGDTIAILVGASASGGGPGYGAAGNQTVATITCAAFPAPISITAQGGGAPTSGSPGAGGVVVYQLLNISPSTYTYPTHPCSLTGGTGGVGGGAAHTYSQGGASALAPGGIGTGLTQPQVDAVLGAGGGGGDHGSNGGAGYACLTIVNRP